MTVAPFEKLAVLGLGLLGGSVAKAARERGLALEVVGAARRPAPLARAQAAGLIDSVASPADAVRGADFVGLGTPVGSMPQVPAAVDDHDPAPQLRRGNRGFLAARAAADDGEVVSR